MSMRKVSLFLGITALSALSQAETVSVFLTGGQSNTEGRIPNSQLPEYLRSNEYALASVHGSVNDETTLGTFEAFAPTGKWAYDAEVYYRIGQALKLQFYVIKTSYGGTSVHPGVSNSPSGHSNEWLPGYGAGYHWSANETFLNATVSAGRTFEQGSVTYDGQSMLKAWIENIDAAIDAIRANGDTPVVKAIIWHQGESDKNSGTYAADLTAVVTYVRNYLTEKLGGDYSTLPFFCGSIPRKSSLYTANIDRAFQTIEETEDNNMHVVDIYDLTMLSDNKHFDAPSAILFGQRLYNRMVDEGVITGDKVDVANCVRSPDFGTQHVINNTTTWLWNESFESMTAVTDDRGMYFHAVNSNSRKVQSYGATATLEWTIGDTTSTNVTKGAYSNFGDNGSNLSSTTTAGEDNSKLQYMAAVNVGRSGKFEVFYLEASDSYHATLYLNGKAVDTVETTKGDLVHLKGTNTGSGVYYIGVGKGTILGARFVPDEEMQAVSVTLDESGWGTLGNLYEANFTLPEGLKAYTVAPVEGYPTLLSLTEVSSVNIGEAVVVRGESGTYNLTPGEGTAYSGENLLVVQETTGVLEPTSGSDFFNFAQGVNENGKLIFTRADGTQELEAGKAFFSITEGDDHALEQTLTPIVPGASSYSWTCNFGDKYESQIAGYVSNASVANSIIGTSAYTGSDTSIFSQETGTAGAKNGNAYLKVNKVAAGGTVAMVAIPSKAMAAEAYTFSFDYMPARPYSSSGSNDNNGMCVVDAEGNILLTTFHTASDVTIYKGEDSESPIGTIAAADTISYNDASASKGKWFRFTLTGDENGVSLAVTKLASGEEVELTESLLSDEFAVPAAVMVKTGNHGSGRAAMAGLDDFAFEGKLPSGITEWSSGTVTESIEFGAALETSEAVAISGGTEATPIVFSAEADIPIYGLTVASTVDVSIGDTAAKGVDEYFIVESGRYAIGENLLVGKQSYTSNGDWCKDYITMNGGTVNVAGNMVYPHGTMNMNGGAWTVGGTLNLANQNRASATINVNGGKLSADRIHVAPYAGDGPTINLNGGTLEVGYFSRQHASYTSKLYFQGGTLKAKANANTFAPAGISFVVNDAGGTIDLNKQNITIANAITGTGTLRVVGGGKLTLQAGSTANLSVAEGTKLEIVAEDAEAAVANVSLPTRPAEVADDTIVSEADYGAYFKKVASETEPGSGVWNVSVVLDEETVDIDETLQSIDMDDLSDSDVTTLTLTSAKPGLYYSIVGGTAVDEINVEGTRTLATSATVSPAKPALAGDGNSAFFYINVSTTDK